MAIEGAINENTGLIKKSDLETESNPLFTQNMVIAGRLKVRHSLIEETMIVLGFIIYDDEFNQDDFLIKGNNIKYSDNKGGYHSSNDILYHKLLINNKLNHFSHFFKEDKVAVFRDKYNSTNVKKVDGVYNYETYEGFKWEYEDDVKFKYYLFTDLISDTPECATNEDVFAVCKYREDGIFKHVIFSFHELTPVETK